jgi:CubicO group peptidase (beta-lactamase class C family)
MSVNKKLPRSTPEEQGISSTAIYDFVDDINKNISELHSFMLLRNGKVIAEGWWNPHGPQIPHMLFSLSKSFTSTAIGMAVHEGLLSDDDNVLSFFPDEAPDEPDDNLKAMKVRHLLSMSTGHEKDPTGIVRDSKDWVRTFLSVPPERWPGTFFCYNTAATYMLSAILQKITGVKLIDYLRPRLFKPLNITGAKWESCPKGINTGGFGLSIKTEDIAKFGQLYMNYGVWNGQRLIAEEWINEATSSHISNGDNPESDWAQGYGYQFWRCRHNAYRGDGAFGQYCVVMPDHDAVLAITAGLSDMQNVLNKVWQYLLPAMHSYRMPADITAVKKLTSYTDNLSHDTPKGNLDNLANGFMMGKKVLFNTNEHKITGIKFNFVDGNINMTIYKGKREQIINCGIGKWAYSRINSLLNDKMLNVAAGGCLKTNDTLQVILRYYETPFYQTITCKFSETSADMEIKMNVQFGDNNPVKFSGSFE